jgi:uncharacterized membrane protein
MESLITLANPMSSAPPTQEPPPESRLASIDWLRGLGMALML